MNSLVCNFGLHGLLVRRSGLWTQCSDHQLSHDTYQRLWGRGSILGTALHPLYSTMLNFECLINIHDSSLWFTHTCSSWSWWSKQYCITQVTFQSEIFIFLFHFHWFIGSSTDLSSRESSCKELGKVALESYKFKIKLIWVYWYTDLSLRLNLIYGM